jgi:hypothetical protein
VRLAEILFQCERKLFILCIIRIMKAATGELLTGSIYKPSSVSNSTTVHLKLRIRYASCRRTLTGDSWLLSDIRFVDRQLENVSYGKTKGGASIGILNFASIS